MKQSITNDEWSVLVKFLPKGWEEEAVVRQAFKRKRNVDSPATLLRLLLIHLAGGASLRTTCTIAEQSGLCKLNDSALLGRLRSSHDWLRWLALTLRQNVCQQSSCERYCKRFRIRLVDASIINEPGNTGSDWRLHYSLDLETLYCDTFTITDCKTGENLNNFKVSKGDLVLGDRAY